MREHRRAKKRRKLDRGGKTARSVAGTSGPPRERVSSVHSSMEATLGCSGTQPGAALALSSTATERERRETAYERNRSPLTRGRRGQSSAPPMRPDSSGKRRRDERVAEVSAAQPCTRSKTPRYGSTARSGSRLLESTEIVSSRPEARWASSNAHRPGPFLYTRPFLHRDRQEAVWESAKGGNGAGRA